MKAEFETEEPRRRFLGGRALAVRAQQGDLPASSASSRSCSTACSSRARRRTGRTSPRKRSRRQTQSDQGPKFLEQLEKATEGTDEKGNPKKLPEFWVNMMRQFVQKGLRNWSDIRYASQRPAAGHRAAGQRPRVVDRGGLQLRQEGPVRAGPRARDAGSRRARGAAPGADREGRLRQRRGVPAPLRRVPPALRHDAVHGRGHRHALQGLPLPRGVPLALAPDHVVRRHDQGRDQRRATCRPTPTSSARSSPMARSAST